MYFKIKINITNEQREKERKYSFSFLHSVLYKKPEDFKDKYEKK